jgi:hypothetical protein
MTKQPLAWSLRKAARRLVKSRIDAHPKRKL